MLRFLGSGLFVTLLLVANLFLVSVLISEAQTHRISISLADWDTGAASSPITITKVSAPMAQGASSIRPTPSVFGQVMGSAGHGIAASSSATAMAFAHTGEAIGHGIFRGAAVAGRAIGHATVAVARVPVRAIGFAVHPSRWGALITPANSSSAPTPTITELRAQQAAIIQRGTKDVRLLPALSGSGGACDNGQGNGGYPMIWCNAPMDSVQTVSYSGDPINRECTSYAYWYFTSVEGNANFHVTGNAKYWANNSNYPVHAAPAVGAIAVETAGAYGHVAIVQALPGQTYDGQAVPAGYALVSEMNYDWRGHFRYSLSPLSKFSSYIYPLIPR
ncbi:MAG TPA: CHAP domain-containing protein [Candidatus Saccharimonadales bacterium]